MKDPVAGSPSPIREAVDAFRARVASDPARAVVHMRADARLEAGTSVAISLFLTDGDHCGDYATAAYTFANIGQPNGGQQTGGLPAALQVAAHDGDRPHRGGARIRAH